jgi:hypothetical protein
LTEAGDRPGRRTSVPPARAPSSPPDAPDPTAIRRAKRLVTIVFLTAVVGWVGFAVAQILRDVLFPTVAASPYPSCGAGLRALTGSLARGWAASTPEQDADHALLAFRAAIEPTWRDFEGVRATCRTPAELRGLDAVERLRYAEEQAVRREATSLALTRQQADVAIAELDPPGAAPQPATPSSSASASTRDPGSRRDREAPLAPTSPP